MIPMMYFGDESYFVEGAKMPNTTTNMVNTSPIPTVCEVDIPSIFSKSPVQQERTMCQS